MCRRRGHTTTFAVPRTCFSRRANGGFGCSLISSRLAHPPLAFGFIVIRAPCSLWRLPVTPVVVTCYFRWKPLGEHLRPPTLLYTPTVAATATATASVAAAVAAAFALLVFVWLDLSARPVLLSSMFCLFLCLFSVCVCVFVPWQVHGVARATATRILSRTCSVSLKLDLCTSPRVFMLKHCFALPPSPPHPRFW